MILNKKIVSTILVVIFAFSALPALPTYAEEAPLADQGAGIDIAPDEADEALSDDDIFAVTAAQSAPRITNIQNEHNGAVISWEKPGSYGLFYKDNADDSWKLLAQVSGTSYTDRSVKDAQERFYTLSTASAPSVYNNDGMRNVYYDAPLLKTVKNTESGVLLEWNIPWESRPEWEGERFIVYRKTASTSWTRIKEYITNSTYTDQTAVNGTTYYYTVRMVNEDGKKFISPFKSSAALTCRIGYPVITKITNTGKGVSLSWGKYAGAYAYRVYHKSASGWTRLTQTASLSYTDTSVKNGENRVYTVRAVDKKNAFVSDFKHTGWTNTFFAPPVIDSLAVSESGITVKWTGTAGVAAYVVYRRTDSSAWTRLTHTSGNTFLDKNVQSGGTYTYTLRAVDADGRLISDHNGGKSAVFAVPPSIDSIENLVGGVKLGWKKPANVHAYRVYYKSDNSWIRLTETTAQSYVDTSVVNGMKRIYTLRAVDAKGKFVSDFNRDGWSNTFYAAPEIKSLTSGMNGIEITWNRTSGAEDYRLYRKTATSSWTCLIQTTDTSYTDTSAYTGIEYTYTLRMITADGSRFMSDCNSGKSITRLEIPEIASIENTDDGAKISWNTMDGVDCFRVYYKGSNGWVRLDTCYGTGYTDTSVADGETRIYTLRGLNSAGSFVTDFNASGWTHTYFAAPVLTSVNYDGEGGYTTEWQAREGVSAYRLYRRELGGEPIELGDTTATTYFDNAEIDHIYCYTLRYLDVNGEPLSAFRPNTVYYCNGSPYTGTVNVNGVDRTFENGVLLEGFVTVNDQTYYYNENGTLAKGQIVGSASTGWVYADPDGVCCMGEDMREAAKFMMTVCRGDTLEERMKYGYLYIAHNFPYERRYNTPKDSSTMPAIALDMFKNHSGNCYCYAACFAYMAKIAGYRVRVTVGATGAGTPHGWAEVYVDGKWLYCDPESELPRFNVPDYNTYMKEDHYWACRSNWHTELTLDNANAVWSEAYK